MTGPARHVVAVGSGKGGVGSHGVTADSGRPLLVDQPDGAMAAAYRTLADRVWAALAAP